jgi:hypothetical protein
MYLIAGKNGSAVPQGKKKRTGNCGQLENTILYAKFMRTSMLYACRSQQ